MKSNKGQLVCQHLENISREALEKYKEIIKEFVRGRHGIYALFRRGKLNYVGLASNLRNRLKIHLRDRHAQTWDRFSVYLTIHDSHLPELETLILKIVRPKGNKIIGNFIKSEDLKPLFKRRIASVQQKELEAMLGQVGKKQIEIKETKYIKGRRAILAPYATKRFEIRFRYKGKLHKATVRRDGSIFYKGKLYNSPSLAGAAVIGHACNGWTAWKYERAPGDWVMLHELRRK
jgi:hypothetical protein